MIVPRPGVAVQEFPDETPFKGRFFLIMIDNYLKLVDVETIRLYDLIQYPKYDFTASHAMSLSRSVKNRKSKLLALSKGDD